MDAGVEDLYLVYLVESLIREGPNARKQKSANQISVMINLKENKIFQGLNIEIGRI